MPSKGRLCVGKGALCEWQLRSKASLTGRGPATGTQQGSCMCRRCAVVRSARDVFASSCLIRRGRMPPRQAPAGFWCGSSQGQSVSGLKQGRHGRDKHAVPTPCLIAIDSGSSRPDVVSLNFHVDSFFSKVSSLRACASPFIQYGMIKAVTCSCQESRMPQGRQRLPRQGHGHSAFQSVARSTQGSRQRRSPRPVDVGR